LKSNLTNGEKGILLLKGKFSLQRPLASVKHYILCKIHITVLKSSNRLKESYLNLFGMGLTGLKGIP
jgi:hypothetical protein